jgi:hypothetical protein
MTPREMDDDGERRRVVAGEAFEEPGERLDRAGRAADGDQVHGAGSGCEYVRGRSGHAASRARR